MRIRLLWPLLLALALAPVLRADPVRPSSFAPHPKRARAAYGAPVQTPVLKRRMRPRPAPRLKDLGPSS
jgi:hypothetical protein